MAYCKQCGAYIPDGQTGCLACGFDEAKKTGTAAAAQAAKRSREDTERLRRQMEEQRARQQEQSRKWAEQEAQRRREQSEAQAAEEDEREQSHIPYSASGDRTGRTADFKERFSTGDSASTSKTMAIISYLSALCFIPLLACKNDPFAMFHAKQGLALFIFTTIGNVLGGLLGIGWIFTVAQIYFIFKGISNASAGKTEPLPYIGTLLKF